MALAASESHYLSNCGLIIHIALGSKYSDQFALPLLKPISHFILNEPESPANILFKDLCTLSEDAELLNRMYHYYNPQGKEEIHARIRLIGAFNDGHATLPQYPLMVVTNTSRIFGTRLRRLRKMVSCDGSSDESEMPDQVGVQFSSQGFLESVPSHEHSFQSALGMFESARGDLSYDQSVHDIFDSHPDMYEIQQIRLDRHLLEHNISHLVYDFGDVDVERTMSDYNRIISQPGRLNRQRPARPQQVAVSQIIGQQNTAKTGQEPNRRPTKYINSMDRPINRLVQVAKSCQDERIPSGNIDRHSPRYNMYRKKVSESNCDHLVQDTDRDRKRKIRDKALQLLSRVRSENYAKVCYPYL